MLSRQPYYELKEHAILSHPGSEEPWNLEIFKSKFSVKIMTSEPSSESFEFDMINIDSSFANAVRRILVAEVPSLAIERVYMLQNTSVMPDEVLCHRLGLIPLNVNPKHIDFPTKKLPDTDEITGFDPKEHLLFDIHVNFLKSDHKHLQAKLSKECGHEGQLASARSHMVYSSDLKWIPLPGQEETFIERKPAPVSPTILINKLTVGDEIQARCLVVKGIGRDHAKFSPVAAAFYKFHPIIKILSTIEGEEALKFQKCFASGVIKINHKTQEAYVANSRLDNGSREHMRHPEFRNAVFVGMDSTHCIFVVESIAPIYRSPSQLVRSALDVMISKCKYYIAITNTPGFGDSIDESKPTMDTSKEDILDAGSENKVSKSRRGQLNGREVSLEVTHISRDKRRATFTFIGEDHTLGCALRFCVLRNNLTTFCGYCVPHPLEDMINFDVQVKLGSSIDVLRDGLQTLHDCFVHIKQAFKNALSEIRKS